MLLRRRVWLSREGWYYIAVLAFIVGGAVLRNVNLLVVLAGMMVAPLVLNWRMVMASLRGMTVQRRLPKHATAGEPLVVELSLTNHRSSFGSWIVKAQDRVVRIAGSRRQSRPRWTARDFIRLLSGGIFGEAVRPEAIVSQVAAGSTVLASYRVTIHRRGRYRFGPLTLSTRYPLGLIRGWVTFWLGDELVVGPRIGQLTQRWRELTEAELLGEERPHPQRGFAEGDYYGLRPWQTGDSQRWIHWRTTAKVNMPTVRQFERQRSHDLAIALDAWLPNEATEEDQGRLELAITMAASAVVELCGKGGGSLAFGIVGEESKVWIGPASTLLAEEILNDLALIDGSARVDWRDAAERLAPTVQMGTPLLVISPRSQTAWESSAAQGEGASLLPGPLHWIDVSETDAMELITLD